MTGGTYTLLLSLDSDAEIEVGALGTRAFPSGGYAYTGSATGPGGFARVARHRRLATGEHDARHWHVDYLLGHPDASVVAVESSPGVTAECRIARAIDGEHVPGFGCSDCDCASHLTHDPDLEALWASIERAHDAVRD